MPRELEGITSAIIVSRSRVELDPTYGSGGCHDSRMSGKCCVVPLNVAKLHKSFTTVCMIMMAMMDYGSVNVSAFWI